MSRFVTGLMAELDLSSGRLRWLSAGHPAPLSTVDASFVEGEAVAVVARLGLRKADVDGQAAVPPWARCRVLGVLAGRHGETSLELFERATRQEEAGNLASGGRVGRPLGRIDPGGAPAAPPGTDGAGGRRAA